MTETDGRSLSAETITVEGAGTRSIPVILVAGLLGLVGAILIWGGTNWPATILFALAIALLGFVLARREIRRTSAATLRTIQHIQKSGGGSSVLEAELSRPGGSNGMAEEITTDNSTEATAMQARDGSLFRYDRELLKGHTVVICRKNLSPPLGEVVELYEELYVYVRRNIRRKAQKLGLQRPPMVSRDLLHALIRTIVLELLRSRNGRKERLRNAYNFSEDAGVRRCVERMLRKHAGCNDRQLDSICGYIFGMTSEVYHAYRMDAQRQKTER